MSYRTYCQGVPFTTVHTYIIVLTSMPLYMYTKKTLKQKLQGLSFAEAEEARTPDNLIKSQVLYQLSYNPILNCMRLFPKEKGID